MMYFAGLVLVTILYVGMNVMECIDPTIYTGMDRR